MKERPILFSVPMVRALLAGTKTQTRRAWPNQPPLGVRVGWVPRQSKMPRYGGEGDRLWVRESFSGPRHQEEHPPRDWHSSDEIWCWADGNPSCGDWTKPRPGIFMPRWASRLTLEITEVRVERLQSISEADAIAEGITHRTMNDPRVEYRWLWESINGADSWEANPWVWCVSFKRIAQASLT